MSKTISIGAQDFGQLRKNDYFYVDKSLFIKEWWESGDVVTLITRPRRFGKTLNMSMLDYFFSTRYADYGALFEGLKIWEDAEYRSLQGKYPVVFLSFAGVKHTDFQNTRKTINSLIQDAYARFTWILEGNQFTDADRNLFNSVCADMDDSTASLSLNRLCGWLYRHYGRKVILLLDEYDTPMQEAYINHFWDELSNYVRALFNNTFKTNPYLERGIMTGITRVSKESVFSELNNLSVVSTTSNLYSTSFGFTEEEVFATMHKQGIPETERPEVKRWYDGFCFGSAHDIYNPWSVTMYLSERKAGPYWANTSGNALVSSLIREGDAALKEQFETLLYGGSVSAEIDEQIIFSQLSEDRDAIWSLLLASGYLKVEHVTQQDPEDPDAVPVYTMSLTNLEVRLMFRRMIRSWFNQTPAFQEFVSSMFKGDVRAMNHYMNRVALNTFSYFDTGSKPSDQKEPERFYHGFVLGLLVDRAKTHMVKSNRESGFGRYDVVMEPKDAGNTAVIMEFKVQDSENGELSLEDTCQKALQQIEDKQYAADLLQRGIPAENILKYGFAFKGEKCLIRKG